MKSIRELKGVGEKTEKLLNRLGIYNTEDLIRYYPRAYEAYDKPIPVCDIREGEIVSVMGRISSRIADVKAGKLLLTLVTIADESGKVGLVWYNTPYIKNNLKQGAVFVFRGRATKKRGQLQLEQPEMITPLRYSEIQGTLLPVYALTAGVSNKLLTKLVKEALKDSDLSYEYLSYEIRDRYQLCDYNYAVSTIHFPRNREELLIARRRLAFDEFLLFILSIRRLKEKTDVTKSSFRMKQTWTTENVINSLPYRLTNAQENVWHEIEAGLSGELLMSRLVQGDVGSGKTILAFLAMIMTAENGYQSALMVPTEVLARQHYEALCKLLEENELTQFCPVLLTGSTRARERREIYAAIEDGTASFVVGTHALIQEKVQYKSLALAITDEQHRFGVRQREKLTTRGDNPHVLVMSATPIPRTLAIIIYGDLDISVIDELPARRLPIKNAVVNTSYRPTAYKFIRNQVESGHQAYIICPMVNESEEIEAENVIDYTEQLKGIMPESIHVEMLHGKMKPAEKNQIMEQFAAGEIHILVSTTVVEVGVNVPNATVMMVENAERFGLAQLHQLRGRVGRGDSQSYCIFVQGNDGEISKRLNILSESNDGFYIAGEDLKLRGPGDMFGVRQSGLMEFSIGDIYRDADILKLASEAADEILSLDSDLSLVQNSELKSKLDSYVSEDLQNPSL